MSMFCENLDNPARFEFVDEDGSAYDLEDLRQQSRALDEYINEFAKSSKVTDSEGNRYDYCLCSLPFIRHKEVM